MQNFDIMLIGSGSGDNPPNSPARRKPRLPPVRGMPHTLCVSLRMVGAPYPRPEWGQPKALAN